AGGQAASGPAARTERQPADPLPPPQPPAQPGPYHRLSLGLPLYAAPPCSAGTKPRNHMLSIGQHMVANDPFMRCQLGTLSVDWRTTRGGAAMERTGKEGAERVAGLEADERRPAAYGRGSAVDPEAGPDEEHHRV